MYRPKIGNKTAIQKRRVRIRKKISGTAERPRLSIYRSLKNTYAQLIDDVTGTTLVSVSTKSKDLASEVEKLEGKTDAAKLVGKELAKRAMEQNIEAVVFDRNGYLYHGRVKAIAEGAREGGLKL